MQQIIDLFTVAPELIFVVWFFSIVLTIAVTYHYTTKANNKKPERTYLCQVIEPGKFINFDPKTTHIKSRHQYQPGDQVPSSYYHNGLRVIKEI